MTGFGLSLLHCGLHIHYGLIAKLVKDGVWQSPHQANIIRIAYYNKILLKTYFFKTIL